MTTFIIAVIAVAFLVLGLSITLIRKGRPLQGDVGENDEMKKRGLECTTVAIRREEAQLRGEDVTGKNYSCGSDCGNCNTENEEKYCNK